jgi:hypothetical protein
MAARCGKPGEIMGKLKQAAIAAQETAEIIGANENLLWQARDALSLAILAPTDAWNCLTNADRALTLINAYLMETELCKR